MGDKTRISWCHFTFNPWIGCQRVSPGCELCYAESLSKRMGLTVWGPQAGRQVTSETNWKKPIKWNREAQVAGERRRVFCASMADVFEDRRDLDEPRARLFDLIESTPALDWLLLTKRPENMTRLAPERWSDDWPSHIWAGATAEDQLRFDVRWMHLHDVPAMTRFLSVEPMLGPIDIERALHRSDELPDWVIIGGESGPDGKRHEMDIGAAERLALQLEPLEIATFVKQDSGRLPGQRGRLADWMWALKEFPAGTAP